LGLATIVGVAIPAHGILLDLGNGVFWRNERVIVVDLDAAQARTYRFAAKDQEPTKLVLVGTNALSADKVQDLIRKANLVWSPPPPDGPPPRPVPDVFETLFVVNGPTTARWQGGPNDPEWIATLKKAIRAVGAAEAP
jgi:hypothetical protein